MTLHPAFGVAHRFAVTDQKQFHALLPLVFIVRRRFLLSWIDCTSTITPVFSPLHRIDFQVHLCPFYAVSHLFRPGDQPLPVEGGSWTYSANTAMMASDPALPTLPGIHPHVVVDLGPDMVQVLSCAVIIAHLDDFVRSSPRPDRLEKPTSPAVKASALPILPPVGQLGRLGTMHSTTLGCPGTTQSRPTDLPRKPQLDVMIENSKRLLRYSRLCAQLSLHGRGSRRLQKVAESRHHFRPIAVSRSRFPPDAHPVPVYDPQ